MLTDELATLCRTLVLLFALICARPALAQPQPMTVRDVLNECRCLVADVPNALLNQETVDHGFALDGSGYAVAFWTAPPTESTEPLHVLAGDVTKGTWEHRLIPVSPSFRSVIGHVNLSRDLVWVSLHYSIDDYAVAVLTQGLELRGWIEGFVEGVWPNGVIAFSPHQPHFGPHYVGLSLFDSRTGKQRAIYPPEPCQPVRCGYAQRLLDAMRKSDGGLSPFIESHGHFGDGSALRAENGSRSVLAWVVKLKNEYPMVTPPGWTEEQTVMVVCTRLDRFESSRCQETPLSEWQKAFPGVSDSELVELAAADPQRIRP